MISLIDETVSPRPDTLYGVSKSFGEALGRLYADKYGLNVACLRIGSFLKALTEERHLSIWLSYRDMVHLVACCIAKQYQFLIIYGISANTRARWRDKSAKIIGYEPQDNAEAFANVPSIIKKTDDAIADHFHGGPFVSHNFTNDIAKID